VHGEVIAVDWSGSADPAGHIALAVAHGGRLQHLEAMWSRVHAVREIVERAAGATGPLVVGLDFSFSLPGWFLRDRGLAEAPDLWPLVAAEGEDWLARCVPPFWGRPGHPRPELEAHFRRTELECQPVAGVRPKSTFQIGGAGAVGAGSLRGMPFLTELSDAGFAIWPFDAAGDRTVLEIYPRLCTGPVNKSSPAARRAALAPWVAAGALDDAQAADAGDSADAFDATLSALVLSRQMPSLTSLGAATEAIDRLEGRIAPVGQGSVATPPPR
jgi:hypothetical protein